MTMSKNTAVCGETNSRSALACGENNGYLNQRWGQRKNATIQLKHRISATVVEKFTRSIGIALDAPTQLTSTQMNTPGYPSSAS